VAGWSTSRAAQAAHGKHLVRIGELIPALLCMHVADRRDLAAAHTARRQDFIDTQVGGLALECRDDLLQTAAVLDAISGLVTPAGRTGPVRTERD
jgi:hypothetical protein